MWNLERLGFLIARRPGFVAPTLAARKIATFDHLTEGRIAFPTESQVWRASRTP
jgi:alkanesulfonate monooxygenase SsuD/methylene tetrahydromethanopterin reductase-like flavin-dependent oxidoreductase (luciferase family)